MCCILIAFLVLVGRPEGKRPLGRPRRGWEDNITKIGSVRIKVTLRRVRVTVLFVEKQ
jgi:hypothetical protein